MDDRNDLDYLKLTFVFDLGSEKTRENVGGRKQATTSGDTNKSHKILEKLARFAANKEWRFYFLNELAFPIECVSFVPPPAFVRCQFKVVVELRQLFSRGTLQFWPSSSACFWLGILTSSSTKVVLPQATLTKVALSEATLKSFL